MYPHKGRVLPLESFIAQMRFVCRFCLFYHFARRLVSTSPAYIHPLYLHPHSLPHHSCRIDSGTPLLNTPYAITPPVPLFPMTNPCFTSTIRVRRTLALNFYMGNVAAAPIPLRMNTLVTAALPTAPAYTLRPPSASSCPWPHRPRLLTSPAL